MEKIRVDVWSDVVCPWCYVGKRRLEAALEKFAGKGDVEVVWRAFELDPRAETPPPGAAPVPYPERIAKKYGKSTAEAAAMIARTAETARADGLDFRFDRARPGNTFDAHRLIHLAGEHGKQDAMKERLLRAYMTEGAAIGERDTLVKLAAEVGLDADEARAALEGERFTDDVRADEREARDIGIRGVPFFVFDGRLAVSGAQPAEVLLGALERAKAERAPRGSRSSWKARRAGPTAAVDGVALLPQWERRQAVQHRPPGRFTPRS